MKRKVISAILILVLCFAFAVCAGAEASAYPLVFDEAALLTDSQAAELNSKLETIGETYGAQLVIMTVDRVADGNVDHFVEATYDGLGLGFGENRDGVLLLISMDPREYRILSNGFVGEAINVDAIESIGNAIVDDLSAGNYAEAFNTYADECQYYLEGYINGYPFPFGMALVVCFVVSLIVALIVTAILKGQLRSVRKQDQANSYVKSGSLRLTSSSDLFLYRTVTRTKKEQNNSSSGKSSSASRSIGGGKF